MKPDLRLVKEPSPVSSASGMLRQIAATLNVPIDALAAHKEPLVLHTTADGAAWHLLSEAQSDPVVRHIGSIGDRSLVTDMSVPDFLMQNTNSPQYGALVALINQLLVVHLAN